MGDHAFESYLKRFRPVGPDLGLRTRILVQSSAKRAWPWMAAAAALFCLRFAVDGAIDRRAAAGAEALEPALIEARVDRITDLLGAGDESRRLATFIVTADEIAREARHIEEQR